jgi:hypothetical protein
MLWQGDAQVFKKYSQMKLQMKREALFSTIWGICFSFEAILNGLNLAHKCTVRAR